MFCGYERRVSLLGTKQSGDPISRHDALCHNQGALSGRLPEATNRTLHAVLEVLGLAGTFPNVSQGAGGKELRTSKRGCLTKNCAPEKLGNEHTCGIDIHLPDFVRVLLQLSLMIGSYI